MGEEMASVVTPWSPTEANFVFACRALIADRRFALISNLLAASGFQRTALQVEHKAREFFPRLPSPSTRELFPGQIAALERMKREFEWELQVYLLSKQIVPATESDHHPPAHITPTYDVPQASSGRIVSKVKDLEALEFGKGSGSLLFDPDKMDPSVSLDLGLLAPEKEM